MIKRLLLTALATIGTGLALGQPDVAMPLITEIQDDINYAQLLHRLALTDDQLAALSQMQDRWRFEAELDEPTTNAFMTIYDAVLHGVSQDQAMRDAGPLSQEIQQKQHTVEGLRRQLLSDLEELVTEEQKAAFIAKQGPVGQFENVIQRAAQGKRAPEEQWRQMVPHLTRWMVHLVQQQTGQPGDEEEIKALLQALRELPEDDLAGNEGVIAEQWRDRLLPKGGNEQRAKQRLHGTLHRLLFYPRGIIVVEDMLSVHGAPPVAD